MGQMGQMGDNDLKRDSVNSNILEGGNSHNRHLESL